jgi:hypothetical protein
MTVSVSHQIASRDVAVYLRKLIRLQILEALYGAC